MCFWNRAVVEAYNKRKTKKNKYAATVITMYNEYSGYTHKNSYDSMVEQHRVANDIVADEHGYEYDFGDDDYMNVNDFVYDNVVGNSYMCKLEKIKKQTTELSMPHNNSSSPPAEDRISMDRGAVNKSSRMFDNRDNVLSVFLYNK